MPGSGQFFTAGSQISVSAVPAAGFRFTHWMGELSGSVSPHNLSMNGPALSRPTSYKDLDSRP